MAQIIQCLGGKTSGFDQISNKDATILYYLANGVQIDFARLIWDDIISKFKKRNREKVIPYPRFLSLLLEHKMDGYGTDELNQWNFKIQTPLLTLRRGFPKANSLEQNLYIGRNQLPQNTILYSTILHYESASGHEASAASIAKANLKIFAPNDSVSKQQGIVKGNEIFSFYHIIAGTTLHVLVDKTKFASEMLETILTEPTTEKDASNAERELEDLSKLILNVEVDFLDLDLPEDDEPIIVQDEDKEETLNSKLVKEKEVAKTEGALVKAQSSFLNVEQLTELLVTSLKPKLLKLLTNHDLSASIPTELKELPSKVDDIFGELKDLRNLTTQVSELRTLQWELPADFLVVLGFAQAIEYASHKAGDQSVPLAGQVSTQPAEGEKNTRQATITQLFKQRAAKDSKKANMNSQPIPTTSHIKTAFIPPIIPTTEQLQSPFLFSPPKPTGSMVESSKKKKLKKFDFVTEEGGHIYLTEKQIKEKKRIEESVKADMSKKEEEVGKEELVDLLGIDVVTNVYKAKINYDKYCDKRLNKRMQSRITKCDVLIKKGRITLKVYREDGFDKVIPNFKVSDLHLGEWREVMQACPKRTGAGWTTIYEHIQKRMENLHKTK
ncbi:hypothetical protein Tco_1207941 [Tanacetum coccineum]